MAIYLFKCCIWVLFVQHSYETVPKNCYKSGTYAYCRPHIPSFLPIYGWDLSGVTSFNLYPSSSLTWTLQTLPNDIFKKANDITHLLMAYTGLEKLPCDVLHPLKNSLKGIYMNGNLFKEFPICTLKDCVALERVNFENQQLKAFQFERMSWNSIRYIYLRNNELSIFNISNVNNKNKVSIYLDNNRISHLQLFDTYHIRFLTAKNNLIRLVNVNIFENSKTSLTFLDFSQNQLDDSIWDVLVGVSSLTTLKLNGNHLSFASASILNSASNLAILDLSNNHLTSLTGVALRSGKLLFLYLGSNELTEIPPFLTSGTETFQTYAQEYDLSNNSIENIDISIPPESKSLTLRLDRNNLRSLNFDNNKIELRTLNISHNNLHLLPYLPNANTYVMSNNPLNTTDVIKKLTNEMLEASVIELENVGLFCGEDESVLPTINNSRLRSLNLKHNCVPLDMICHINTSCTNLMSLYLDNNTATTLSCSLRNSCFDVLSVNDYNWNNSIAKHIIVDANPQYFRKISARHNDVIVIPMIQNTWKPNAELNYDYSMNRIKMFEGFNISAYKLNLDFKNNEISSIKQGTVWLYHIYPDLRLSFANNSLININDSLVSIYFPNTQVYSPNILIDLSYNSIKELKLTNVIKFQTKHKYRLYGSFQVNINLSHNSIHSLDGCLELDSSLSLYLLLDLSFNNITALPNSSCRMAYKMYLGYNKIRRISTPIPQARTRILDLKWNMITDIHLNAFVNLTELRELNLRGNRIEDCPSSIKTLKLLIIFDISFNRIRHISQCDFNNLKSLQQLIITDNSFLIPVTDLQLNKHYHLEANEIYCDCDMLFLRNQSFTPQFRVTGRCKSPPEYEGYHVSCFPVGQCIGFVPLYINKATLETCQKDKFADIITNTTVLENVILILTNIIGQRKPRILSMKAYKNGELVRQEQLNITGRSNVLWLDRNLGPNKLCFSSVFDDNDTLVRCFPVKIQAKHTNDKLGKNNETLYGVSSVLALSLFINILIGIFTLISYRNRRKKHDNQHLHEENNTETCEITSVAYNAIRGSVSQPMYEEILAPKGNSHEHTYSNLTLDG